MRWKLKEKPKENDTRIVNMFLLFPIRIGNERRWLEMAKIEQKYVYTYTYDNGFAHEVGNWVDIKFID